MDERKMLKMCRCTILFIIVVSQSQMTRIYNNVMKWLLYDIAIILSSFLSYYPDHFIHK